MLVPNKSPRLEQIRAKIIEIDATSKTDTCLDVLQTAAGTNDLSEPGDSGLDELISEYDGSNTLLSDYGYGAGPDEPLMWWDFGAGAFRSVHADERGSILAVGDGVGSGGAYAINRYDEYGNPQGTTITGRFGYTGQIWLPEIGLSYYKARFYSPALGRFMQTDPIGPADDANLYQYALNDPVNNVDPMGLSGCDGTDPTADCREVVIDKRLKDSRPSPASGGFAGGGGSFGGGGSSGGGGAGGSWGLAEDNGSSKDEIIITGSRGQHALLTPLRRQPNMIYFGYPPIPNNEWHSRHNLVDAGLTPSQIRRIRQLIRADILSKYAYLQPNKAATDFVHLGNIQVQYRAFGLPGGITNVGTSYVVGD